MSGHPQVAPDNSPVSLPELLMIARQLPQYAADFQSMRSQRDRARRALREARVDALLRLASAVEQKDNDTGRHVERIGHFSAAIARAMGQEPDWCELLLYASRMHDVGKIGIPDAILKKPGPLSEAEWAVMRRHPEIGATLLGGSDSPLYRMAAEVSLGHHEKFDGSGYPSGLTGEAIPLSARIVAVADFFDALTSDRCYRKALPLSQAIVMLHEGRGSHFDPAVLAAFFLASKELFELRRAINAGELDDSEAGE